MLIVAALGGNALLRRGERLEAEVQRRNVAVAARALATVARDHELVVTHGNGPQVGLLALQNAAYREVRAYPLDVLGAESEGMIGYMIEQELANELPDRDVVTMLTQVVVDRSDPAFASPTKPIGPLYAEPEARRLAHEHRWSIALDPPSGAWRRVVASPEPRAIVELPAIRILLAAGVLVVCAGGGGIPVVTGNDGARHGVEAVVDKDAAAALLADRLDADLLLLLTDVDAVELGYGTAAAKPIGTISADELGSHAFAPGSMQPKVDAARRFVAKAGRRAAIGSLGAARELVRGDIGTQVMPNLVRSEVRASV